MAGMVKIIGSSGSRERGTEGLMSEELKPDHGWFVLLGWIEVDEKDEKNYPPNLGNMSEDAIVAILDEDAEERLLIEIVGMRRGDKLLDVKTQEMVGPREEEYTVVRGVEPGEEYEIRRSEGDPIHFKIVE
jgi:hypothetical protein